MPNEIQTFSLFDFKQLGIDSRCLWCATAAGRDAFKSVKQNPYSSLDRNHGHCIAVLFYYQQIGDKKLYATSANKE